MVLRTEYAFTLPCGLADDSGNLHREGIMRRATARDEVEPLGDARVRANEAYLSVLLLSRVVTRLGDVRVITPEVIENLFAPDFLFLQELYLRVNGAGGADGPELAETQCPQCGARFTIDLSQPVADANG